LVDWTAGCDAPQAYDSSEYTLPSSRGPRGRRITCPHPMGVAHHPVHPSGPLLITRTRSAATSRLSCCTQFTAAATSHPCGAAHGRTHAGSSGGPEPLELVLRARTQRSRRHRSLSVIAWRATRPSARFAPLHDPIWKQIRRTLTDPGPNPFRLQSRTFDNAAAQSP
jgi:hypothetical protein